MLRLAKQVLQATRARTLPSTSGTCAQTQGIIIEIIGVRGIGKTTLNNSLVRHFRSRWLYRHQLVLSGPEQVAGDAIEYLHADIFKGRMRRIENEGMDPWIFLTTAKQVSTVVYESLAISTRHFDKGIILDEGLFKNFPEDILDLDQSQSRALWLPRAFIYLRARDPEFAAARFSKRVAERRQRGLYQHDLTQQEVCQNVAEYQRVYDAMFTRAKEYGCPALMVYAEDDPKQTIDAILAFERALSRQT